MNTFIVHKSLHLPIHLQHEPLSSVEIPFKPIKSSFKDTICENSHHNAPDDDGEKGTHTGNGGNRDAAKDREADDL